MYLIILYIKCWFFIIICTIKSVIKNVTSTKSLNNIKPCNLQKQSYTYLSLPIF